jgi:BCD family chlorophyll transporter-like MFS transporter
MMMIFGLAFTAVVAGKFLDPYTPARLVAVMASVCVAAWLLACLSINGLEERGAAQRSNSEPEPGPEPQRPRFREALAQVWTEPDARRFTIFIFVSMLAFSAQDLILEPFAGTVFGWTPGQTTQLSGLQHGGVLMGMVLVALAGAGLLGRQLRSLRGWAVGGCLASAMALGGLVAAGVVGPGWPLALNVFLLGAANGAFSIAAIASMMRLAGEGRQRREGVRMGLWGAAQAMAFGLGGALGAGASDLARWLIGSPAAAYSLVFAAEAALFVLAAMLALKIGHSVAKATEATTPGTRPGVSSDSGSQGEPSLALGQPR